MLNKELFVLFKSNIITYLKHWNNTYVYSRWLNIFSVSDETIYIPCCTIYHHQ